MCTFFANDIGYAKRMEKNEGRKKNEEFLSSSMKQSGIYNGKYVLNT